MEAMESWLSDSDLLFLVERVMPGYSDKRQAVSLIKDDPDFIEAMLGHEGVFEYLLSDKESLLKVSPQLFFSVLLTRARRDLEAGAYTVERRQGQRVAIFDAKEAARLLGDRALREYLATMLASFTRIQSFTRRVRVRKGVWRRQRFNELDIDGLIRYCSTLDEEHRFQLYRRIADACLFLAGMFPEYIEGQRSYIFSPRLQRRIEDYEREGQTFYGLAAGHRAARASALSGLLSTLAENFCLAEKPLTFLSEHYLQLRKHALFEL